MKWDEFFFKHVFLTASKSKDPSSQVGAVIVKDGIVISEGYNGFPRGVKDLESRLNERPVRLAYTVHGEHNAVLNCARRGVSTVDGVLYTTAFPCDQCMKAIIQAGIKKVIYSKAAQDAFYNRPGASNWDEIHSDAKVMAQEAGVEILAWDGKADTTTRIGGKQVEV